MPNGIDFQEDAPSVDFQETPGGIDFQEEGAPSVDRETIARGLAAQLGAAETVSRMTRSPIMAELSGAGQQQIARDEAEQQRIAQARAAAVTSGPTMLSMPPEYGQAAATLAREAAAAPGRVATALYNAEMTSFPRAEVPGRKPRFIIDERSGELRQQTPEEFIAEGRTVTPGQPLYQPRNFLDPSDMDKILMEATTPESLLTLPIGASRLGAKVLLFSMIPGLADSVSDIARSDLSPDEKRQQVNSLIVPALLGLSATRPPGMRLPELPSRIPPGPDALPETPVPPPLEFTGAAIPDRPKGALPQFQWGARQELHPMGPTPEELAGTPPQVPGTPAQPRETVIESIRKANARTTGAIQRLFPERGLTRQQAQALRNKAWGPPEQPPGAPPAGPQPPETPLEPPPAAGPTPTPPAPPGAPPAAPAAPPAAPEPPPAPPTPPAAPTPPPVPKEPPPAPGMVRLYQGSGGPEGAGTAGNFWTANPERASSYGPNVRYVDVPADVAKAAQAEARRQGSGTAGDHVLPNEWVKRSQEMAQPPQPKVFDTDIITKPEGGAPPQEPPPAAPPAAPPPPKPTTPPRRPDAPVPPDKFPPLPPGNRRVTIRRADGTTYEAAASNKEWPKDTLPPGVTSGAAIHRVVLDDKGNPVWSTAFLDPGESIVEHTTPASPPAPQPAAPAPAPPPAAEPPPPPSAPELTWLGKPISYWEKIAEDLPKGDERARLAKSLGVPNQPAKIRQHINRRIAEIKQRGARPAKVSFAAYWPEGAAKPEVGANHPEILNRLGVKGFEKAESRNTPQFGFVDENGQFLTREQAAERAKLTGQDLKEFEADEPAHSDEIASPTEPEKPISEQTPPTPAASAAPAPTAPTPPAAPAAEQKVQAEVTKTAQQAGTAEAKAAKAEIIRQTEEALAKAPEAYEVGHKAKMLTFDIPNDGIYKVLNTKQALSAFLTEAKRLATTPAPARPKVVPVSAPSVTEEAIKVAKAYGSVEAAYRSVKRQRDALPDNDPETPAKVQAADALLSALFDQTKAADLEAKADAAKRAADQHRMGQESFTKEIARLRGLKRPTAKHRQEIISLEERLAENRARTKSLDAEAEQLIAQAETARAELEGELPSAPSVGPGAASPAEFAERPDPEVIGVNIGSPAWNRISRGWTNLKAGVRQLISRHGEKQDIMMLANEANNLPYMTGQQAGNSIRVRTTEAERTALTFIIQSLKMSGEGLGPDAEARLGQLEHRGDPLGYLKAKQTDLETAAQDFNNRGLRLEAQSALEAARALRYARQNFNRLRPLADLVKRKFDLQLRREESAGIHTDYENWYVPQRHELDLFTSGDRPIILGHSRAGGIGTNFKKAKVFEDYATAIENGFVPRSLDIGDLLEHRVTQGERIIARKVFYDNMRSITDPVDGKPVVIDIPKRKITRPDGTIDTQETLPLDYSAHEVIPGYRVGVHKGYDRLVNALTAHSQLAESAAFGALQDIAAVEKHIGLALDTFHASRTLQAELALTGKVSLGSRQRLGRALVEYSLADLDAAVSKGEITQEMADFIQTRRPIQIHGRTVNASPHALVNFGARNGLNVGRFADALYKDWLREIPITGAVNRWVFDKMTRSAIANSFLAEFERVAAARPDLTAQQVARTVSRDINVLFGNLQKESIFRNPSLRSIMQVLFLAPQWVEALARREGRTLLQLGKMPVDIAMGRPTHLPTTAKAVGTGLAAYFVATQLTNLITRHQLTFSNPEEGHRLDAWLPLGPRGMFISPLSVFGEITHDIIRYAQTKPDLASALQQIGGNKLGNLGRFLDIAALGRDPLTGHKIVGTARRAVRAAVSLVPVPITLSQGLQAAASRATGGAVPAPPPGAVQRQALSSLGVKAEPAPSAQTRIFQMVDRWKMQAGPKYQHEVERRQAEDFGPSDYGPLRQALAAGDMRAAQGAYRDLRNQGKTPRTIDQTISKPHPFTGSRVAEAAFMQTLTPEQREIYRQALEERKQLLKQFRQMQSTR